MIGALQPDLIIGVHTGWALLEWLTREATTHRIPVIVTSTERSSGSSRQRLVRPE
jgi:hypothetical protein